ncbi:MAG: cytochrome c-type biogenesis protein CcmH [Anaerolineales bacterium]
MKRVIFVLVLLVLIGGAVMPTVAQEDGPTPSPDQVNKIASNLYCPVCANVPLDACGTAACAQWRQQIADLLEEGYSEQQIYDYFAQYGPGVLAAPPAGGLNWLIYVLPPAVILLGAWLLWGNLRKFKIPAALEKKTLKSEYTQRLEDELKARQ